MTVTNGYLANAAALKPYLNIPSADTADDTALEVAIEAASRLIDDFCGRFFYDTGDPSAQLFVPDDAYRLWLPDFSTTDGLVVEQDTTGDGTYDTTWASTDWQAEPLQRDNGYPYTSLVAVGTRTWPTGSRRALIRVTAQWGWAAIPKRIVQACAIQAETEFKRATEGAAPIVTMDGGKTINGSRYLDRSVERLIRGFARMHIGAV